MSVATSYPLFEKLDSEFRKTSKILFGDEIGPLKEFTGYLSEQMQMPRKFPSGSGKDVYLTGQGYFPSSKFASFDEIDWGRKFEPLGINEIKDIDSIARALREKFVYTGNVVLGKSANVEKSTNVTDSFFVYNSSFISNCEYVAYTSFSRNCRHLFGTHDTADSTFLMSAMNVGGHGCSRIFESSLMSDCSDIFYSYSMLGCQKCCFSFFQRGKRYRIGNLQLDQQKYARLESSLTEQMRDDLQKKRSTYRLMDIFRAKKKSGGIKLGSLDLPTYDENKAREAAESAFMDTTKVLLGKELFPLDDFGPWLTASVDFYEFLPERSPVTGKDIFAVKKYWKYEELKGVFVGDEGEKLGDFSLSGEEISGNLREMVQNSARIAFLTTYISQNCTNIDAPLTCVDSANSYRTIMPVYTKNTAFSFWPRESANIFGSTCAFKSSFCMKSSYSQGLIRAFEVDSAYSSSDLYFCHNVEGLSNGMFCFNVKSMRNAIGNAEYGKESYMKVKNSLMEQIAGELESKKTLRWSIYSIGAHEAGK
ncbi:MAG: hypothetical protein PHS02_01820 [Candidatus ainarchaeum sp.]|nr:hypothetical protein [Candidatus ainarchaeum sp.]